MKIDVLILPFKINIKATFPTRISEIFQAHTSKATSWSQPQDRLLWARRG